MKIIRDFLSILENVQDLTTKQIYKAEIEDFFKIPKDEIFQKLEVKKTSKETNIDFGNQTELLYKEFLSLFVNTPDWNFKKAIEVLPSKRIMVALYRRIYEYLIVQHFNKDNISLEDFTEEERQLISEICIPKPILDEKHYFRRPSLEDDIRSLWYCVKRIFDLYITSEIDKIYEKLIKSEPINKVILKELETIKEGLKSYKLEINSREINKLHFDLKRIEEFLESLPNQNS